MISGSFGSHLMFMTVSSEMSTVVDGILGDIIWKFSRLSTFSWPELGSEMHILHYEAQGHHCSKQTDDWFNSG